MSFALPIVGLIFGLLLAIGVGSSEVRQGVKWISVPLGLALVVVSCFGIAKNDSQHWDELKKECAQDAAQFNARDWRLDGGRDCYRLNSYDQWVFVNHYPAW